MSTCKNRVPQLTFFADCLLGIYRDRVAVEYVRFHALVKPLS